MTVAPAAESVDAVIYVGRAAHIRAASPGGARYDANQASEARKGIENGLFLCAICADMIDRNGGADYPVATLLKWKEEHEAWIRANLNKRPLSVAVVDGEHIAVGRGEVTALDIEGPVLLQPGTRSIAHGEGIVTATRVGRGPRGGS